MRDPVVVSFKECKNLRWEPPKDVAFAQSVALIPLTVAELSASASSMPMAFVKQKEGWSLVGVCGIEPGHNLFVRNGQWLGAYRPNWLQNWPFDFILLRDKAYMVFDKGSGVLVSEGGEPFFEDEQKMGSTLEAVSQRMRSLARPLQQTRKAVQSLSDAGVLMPWPDNVVSHLEGFNISGLYMLNEKALAQLNDQKFLALRSFGALALGYAVNLSIGQTHILKRLQKIHPAQKPEEIADLEAFFEEDDNLSF